MNNSKNIRKAILRLISDKKRIKTADIVAAFKNKVSRQYVSRIINELMKEGRLVRIGNTRYAFYASPHDKDNFEIFFKHRYKKRLTNVNLKEHEVLNEINKKLIFLSEMEENVRSIFDYSFSEMLNNAIEHSESKNVEIEVSKDENTLTFTISDFGIGVFRNIMKKRKLKTELEAIQDLLKGKITTQPKAHSGEGIFFTSKIADIFVLESFGFRLIVDNTLPDVFIEAQKPIKRGTRVVFSINLETRKHLSDVFKKFQTDDNDGFGFSKTEIKVKLFTIGTIHVSRSQARRLLVALDKFKTITLDFERVPTIGQAFADEIFRVFQGKHPDIEIIPINTNEASQFMIDRVEKPSKNQSALF